MTFFRRDAFRAARAPAASLRDYYGCARGSFQLGRSLDESFKKNWALELVRTWNRGPSTPDRRRCVIISRRTGPDVSRCRTESCRPRFPRNGWPAGLRGPRGGAGRPVLLADASAPWRPPCGKSSRGHDEARGGDHPGLHACCSRPTWWPGVPCGPGPATSSTDSAWRAEGSVRCPGWTGPGSVVDGMRKGAFVLVPRSAGPARSRLRASRLAGEPCCLLYLHLGLPRAGAAPSWSRHTQVSLPGGHLVDQCTGPAIQAGPTCT